MTYAFVVAPVVGDEAELPAMLEVRQHFDVLPPPAGAVDPALRRPRFDAAGNLVSPFTGA